MYYQPHKVAKFHDSSATQDAKFINGVCETQIWHFSRCEGSSIGLLSSAFKDEWATHQMYKPRQQLQFTVSFTVKPGLSNNRRVLRTGRRPLQKACPSLLHEEIRTSYIWKTTDIWSHWILEFCPSFEELGKKLHLTLSLRNLLESNNI